MTILSTFGTLVYLGYEPVEDEMKIDYFEIWGPGRHVTGTFRKLRVRGIHWCHSQNDSTTPAKVGLMRLLTKMKTSGIGLIDSKLVQVVFLVFHELQLQS